MPVSITRTGIFPGPIEGKGADLVISNVANAGELVSAFNAESSSTLSDLLAGGAGVDSVSADLTYESPPYLGGRPTTTHPGSYESIFQEVTFPEVEELRGLLNLTDITVDQVVLPPFEYFSPSITIPPTPTDELPTIPDDVPNIDEHPLPGEPPIDLPPVPVLNDVAIPPAPTIENLQFEGTLPDDDLTPPEPMFVYNEDTYDSNVADALRTKLYQDIVYGGTGLNAETEQAIWDRASDRLEYELTKGYNAELNNFESWGFELPDGVLSANLREVLAEGTRRRSELNNDILIQQSNLAQENTKFAITSGLVHEQQLMSFANQISQRSFEVAKTKFTAVLDIYKIKVEAFTVKLQGYQAQAAVFESRIRAELAKAEIYKTQMEGARLAGELNVQAIEIYTRRIQAVQTLIDLYRARMDGAKLKVDVDRIKLDGFRALLDAKRSQIEGVTAKYNLYQAQIAGEEAKVSLYAKQVDAYGTQVSAKKVEADINLAEAQALIESNKNKVAVLEAAIGKYKADTDYQVSIEGVNVQGYAAETNMYSAEVDRERGYLTALVDEFRSRVDQVMAHANLGMKELETNTRAAVAVNEINVEALKSAANISAQKVASAMASVSTSTSLGYNESVSNSYSGVASASYSGSESVSDSHVYDETKSTPEG